MNCSFTPEGDWFVFDEASSRTLKRGFKTKFFAVQWIRLNERPS